ncbi:MAG: tetratricopeptide repeat protein [Sphingomonadaceae bacterium]|uniref:tetratricopeptide repeat protein n=1 Tax=Thermaurantiacus sp. TaxID=2820283 RepID=UPI00298F0128|nr:tetratricopeptide repeat protein [Thermaurantiacus sp.]MCS6985991.1 tetratricopeptide repeat protein [Sphingomonadaceae bacterium]MDW8414793.1 tetratricopeptide repeat protein [Thermaurantiacus sp.]
MRNVSMRALIAAVVASLAWGGAPALAQRQKAPSYKLSWAVQPLLAEAQKAQNANDHAAAIAALDRAAAVADATPDDRYLTGVLLINSGISLKDNAVIKRGVTLALESGRTPPEDQAKFVRTLGALALQENDTAGALAHFERYLQLNPNDAPVMAEMAELYRRQKQPQKSVEMMRRAIEVQEKTSNAKADETWYRRLVAIAYDANLPAETTAASEALVRAYPNPTNWRDVVVIWRETNRLDDQTNLDALRLQRAARALTGERDFYEYAELASFRGLPGESKAVIDEGVAAGALNLQKQVVRELNAKVTSQLAADKASLATAEKEARAAANARVAMGAGEAFLGYGQYEKAAEMFRLALTKTGVDPAVANTRLGIALARAGDKAGAAQAFAAVTTPPRAQLARFWQIWNEQRP